MQRNRDEWTGDVTGRSRARAGLRVTGARTAVTAMLCLMATPALAYVGPGAGLGFLGTLFGIFAAVVLAMVGLFWYPLKRAFGKKTVAVDGREPEQEEDETR